MVGRSFWVEIPLPRGWLDSVKSAVLQVVVSLARFAIIHTRSCWAADSSSARVRLKAGLEEAQNDIALLEEEIRGSRMLAWPSWIPTAGRTTVRRNVSPSWSYEPREGGPVRRRREGSWSSLKRSRSG